MSVSARTYAPAHGLVRGLARASGGLSAQALSRIAARSRAVAPTIALKLVGGIAVLMALLAVFFFLYVPHRLQQEATQDLRLRAHSVGAVASYAAAGALYFQDPAGIEEALRAARQDPDVMYLVAFDERRRRVASSGYVIEAASSVGAAVKGGLYHVRLPLMLNDEPVGELALGVTMRPIEARMSRIRLQIAWVSLALFGCAMLAVAWVSLAVTRPLGRITQTVGAIADGDFSLRAPVSSADEVGQLAMRFNDMLDRLESSYFEVRQLNAGLRVQQTALEREIAERVRYEGELIAARDQAEEMARLKSSFLANMSHEIRTPLTAILGFSEILLDEAGGPAREFAELIHSGSRRLLDTINSVLDLARLESGQWEMTRELRDLGPEVYDTVRTLTPLAHKKSLTLKVLADDGVCARVDTSALARVVTNLVGNAIKFTERGGVTVRVAAHREMAVVSVRDSGVGIAPEFLPHLFEEFRQESSGHARSHEGTGLGLALTRRMVELMGGRIAAESVKGAGSVFTVAFPLAGSALEARMDSASPQGSAPASCKEPPFGSGHEPDRAPAPWPAPAPANVSAPPHGGDGLPSPDDARLVVAASWGAAAWS